MFGITITAVGCYEGLSTGGGAEEIGRSTTQAVVISIFSVIAVDLVFTAIFFFISGNSRGWWSGEMPETQENSAQAETVISVKRSARAIWRAGDSARHQLRRGAFGDAGDSGRLRLGQKHAAAHLGGPGEAQRRDRFG
jgi:hypothetical protein